MRNKRLFEKIVRKTQSELKDWLNQQLIASGYQTINKDGFLYAAGSIPVMLIAHMDTVHKTPVYEVCWNNNYNVAMSPQGIGGDDRCGVYMILRTIRELQCHVLFCEDEEIGAVGADKFIRSNIKPMVNFLIEFDRRGSNDAVFYDCDNEDFIDLLEKYGFSEEFGSFSDISVIAPALKVAAVNISSGYYDCHTRYESVNMMEMHTNVDRIVALIKDNKDKFFKYIPAVHTFRSKYSTTYGNSTNWRNYYGYGGWYDDEEDEFSNTRYDTYGNSYSSGYLTSRNTNNNWKWIMPLPRKKLSVLTVDDEYSVEEEEAECFGIDMDSNLYVIEYDDVWNFIDGPCDIYDPQENRYIAFNTMKARKGTVDYAPLDDDAAKPWVEDEDENKDEEGVLV